MTTKAFFLTAYPDHWKRLCINHQKAMTGIKSDSLQQPAPHYGYT